MECHRVPCRFVGFDEWHGGAQGGIGGRSAPGGWDVEGRLAQVCACVNEGEAAGWRINGR